jgi:integrase
MPNTHGHRGWGHIRRLPSGRYQASYVGPYDKVTRHYPPSTYGTRELAERWLAGERRLIEAGKWSPPAARTLAQTAPATTLAAYAKVWVAERKLRPRARDDYEGKLRLHIAPTPLGRAPITDLSPQLVRGWYAGLGDTHRTRNAHLYSLLHAIAETAVDDGLLDRNPCQIVGAMHSPARRAPVVPSIGQLAALADAMPERFKALILLKAWCGLRWGEVIELRRSDTTTTPKWFMSAAGSHTEKPTAT